MKHLFLFTVFVLTTLTIFSQGGADTSLNLKLKKGIYLSFEQITKENPANTDSFIIKERSAGSIAMVGGGKYTFEFASMSNGEFKKYRKELVGISDGENFYISDKYTIKGWQGLTRCVLTGPYIIAPVKGSAGQSTGGGAIPSMISIGKGFLINLNEGTSEELSKKVIKKLLTKYPDISKEYADKDDLMDMAVEIVEKINKAEHSR